jgi:hypothetical protein
MVRRVTAAGPSVSDIFREIEDELRRDNYLKLWQRYGKYVIAVAVAAVAVAGVIAGWREYQARQSQAEGVRYAAALELAQQNKAKDAEDAFAAVAQSAASGRALLARFEQAAQAAKSGDIAGARAIYDGIIRDGGAGQIYRDLATLLLARFELDKDPKAAVEALQPLTDANNPWHPTALELSAVAALKQGDTATARTIYQRLADDLGAPESLRARAAEMVGALGS